MNPLALALNKKIEGSAVYALLSDFGKRFYFPRGIVAQTGEAKERANRYNVTLGMAALDSHPLFMEHVREMVPALIPEEIFPYAPSPGLPALRQAWKEEMVRKNPTLRGKTFSLPLVTSGLTSGISTVADLFFNSGDRVVVPDMFWGNYRLILEGRLQVQIDTFPFFTDRGGLNLTALEDALKGQPMEKSALLLNFPNNPTGYTPTEEEMKALSALLGKLANEGRKILVISDDAYFGFVYEAHVYGESLFGLLADLHENILAVKVDGATKEELAWGFRVGFITYGARGLTEEQYAVLDKKTGGAVRSSISNSSMIGQSLVLKGLQNPAHDEARTRAVDILKARYLKVKEVVGGFGPEVPLKSLPFNSGYFMTFLVEGKSAEALRLSLLDNYGIGAISIEDRFLRVAYSLVNLENIEELFDFIGKAAREL